MNPVQTTVAALVRDFQVRQGQIHRHLPGIGALGHQWSVHTSFVQMKVNDRLPVRGSAFKVNSLSGRIGIEPRVNRQGGCRKFT